MTAESASNCAMENAVSDTSIQLPSGTERERRLGLILEGYRLGRHKSHGGGPAPRRQALMLGIMRWEIAHRMFRFRAWRLIHQGLMRLLYVRELPGHPHD